MTRILPASEVKTKFYKLIDGVAVGDEIIVTKNGKPTVAMLSAQELSSLKETLDVLSDPELMRQIRAGEKQLRQGRRLLSFEEVFGGPPSNYSSGGVSKKGHRRSCRGPPQRYLRISSPAERVGSSS